MHAITLTSDICAHICTQEIYLYGKGCGDLESKEDFIFIYYPVLLFFTQYASNSILVSQNIKNNIKGC